MYKVRVVLSRISLLAVLMLQGAAAQASFSVVYNQLGYLPQSSKLIKILAVEEQAPMAYGVVAGDTAHSGKSSVFVFDEMSSRWVSTVDLSEITREGNLTLTLAGKQHHMVISSSVYDGLLQQLLRSYYLQRCGVPLDDKLTQLSHAICHAQDGKVSVRNDLDEAGATYAASGGWHDAGDYGKYVSTTAVTISQLLHLFERYPDVFEARSHYIPESRNRLPDILDEVRVGLDWLLSMQRKDGAFYRKLSGKAWPSLVPPDEDTQTRYLFGVASDDTGKAVAALARAARIFRRYDTSQSDKYLIAAKAGWDYLKTQSVLHIDLHAEDDKGSGPYRLNKIDQDAGLTHHNDDRLAASTQLFLTTAGVDYRQDAIELLADAEIALFEWKNPSLLSMLELLEHPKMRALPKLALQIRDRLRTRAEESVARAAKSPLSLANHRLVWGSNKMTAAEGSLLLYAGEFLELPAVADIAQAQLDYLLGANPHQQTFVSGVGERPVRHVSHIFARAIGQDIPGLFVGGANEAAQAGKAPKNLGLLSYIDDAASYATNEYAIDYNAALIGLVVQLISYSDHSKPQAAGKAI